MRRLLACHHHRRHHYYNHTFVAPPHPRTCLRFPFQQTCNSVVSSPHVYPSLPWPSRHSSSSTGGGAGGHGGLFDDHDNDIDWHNLETAAQKDIARLVASIDPSETNQTTTILSPDSLHEAVSLAIRQDERDLEEIRSASFLEERNILVTSPIPFPPLVLPPIPGPAHGSENAGTTGGVGAKDAERLRRNAIAQERFTVLRAMLDSGDVEGAEFMYLRLVVRFARAVNELCDVAFFNSFMQEYTDRVIQNVNLDTGYRVYQWMQRMKQAGKIPNEESYAYCLRTSLELHRPIAIRMLLRDMHRMDPIIMARTAKAERKLPAKASPLLNALGHAVKPTSPPTPEDILASLSQTTSSSEFPSTRAALHGTLNDYSRLVDRVLVHPYLFDTLGDKQQKLLYDLLMSEGIYSTLMINQTPPTPGCVIPPETAGVRAGGKSATQKGFEELEASNFLQHIKEDAVQTYHEQKVNEFEDFVQSELRARPIEGHTPEDPKETMGLETCEVLERDASDGTLAVGVEGTTRSYQSRKAAEVTSPPAQSHPGQETSRSTACPSPDSEGVDAKDTQKYELLYTPDTQGVRNMQKNLSVVSSYVDLASEEPFQSTLPLDRKRKLREQHSYGPLSKFEHPLSDWLIQLKLEEQAYDLAVQRFKVYDIQADSSLKRVELKRVTSDKDEFSNVLQSVSSRFKDNLMRSMLAGWFSNLVNSLQKSNPASAGDMTRTPWIEIFRVLDAHTLASITIFEMLKQSYHVQESAFSDISNLDNVKLNPLVWQLESGHSPSPGFGYHAGGDKHMLGAFCRVNRVTMAIGKAVENEVQVAKASRLRKGFGSVIAKKRSTGTDPVVAAELEKLKKHLKYQTAIRGRKDFDVSLRHFYRKLQSDNEIMKLGWRILRPESDPLDDSTLALDHWVSETQKRWSSSICAKIGALLLDRLIQTATLDASKEVAEIRKDTVDFYNGDRAFQHGYSFIVNKKFGVVWIHDNLVRLLASDPPRDIVEPKLLPMVVPPRPWVHYRFGGYLTSRNVCMRVKTPGFEQLAYLKAAARRKRIDFILACLDVLGATPWRVNQAVFEVALEAWNSGEEVADIPKYHNSEDKASMYPQPPPVDSPPEKRKEYRRAFTRISRELSKLYGMRIDAHYKVSIAKSFLGKVIYFPHNMDFRGRAYPIPPHFNHISSDLCRGLLMFAETKPLGERGWFWLRVQLANLFGKDKASFDDRVAWVMENMDKVMDACDNPLNGTRWWLKGDSPWQVLAACIDITRAVRSGNPATYESQLTVHQDGSCNGLQHYAALGGDFLGAQQVNLVAADKPADIYTAVANLLAERVQQDAQAGVQEAKAMINHITRKLVKQTVMTNVYGVTKLGAQRQIRNRLTEMGLFKDDDAVSNRVSVYLATSVFKCLGTLFVGAQKIQDWLAEAAKAIASSVPAEQVKQVGKPDRPLRKSGQRKKTSKDISGLENATKESQGDQKPATLQASGRFNGPGKMTSVIWTTPLGLTCVQPYRAERRIQVMTSLQSIFLDDDEAQVRPVSVRKQRSAFPPNFIHSLDASHMMISAMLAHRRGLTFAAVHDSYWTHACDVDTLNDIIRDAFVRLHGRSLIDDLRNEFVERYAGYVVLDPKTNEWVPIKFPPIPERGAFEVDAVRHSRYFFH